MTIFIDEQMSVSTAEDEANYFTGKPESLWHPNPSSILPPGIYRVIEGQLYRVVVGIPPTRPLTETGENQKRG